jgi:tRNA(His) guanylyltransferase
MNPDSLGDRMKQYESVTKNFLVRRMPAILRLDGRAFHTLTAKFNKPFDVDIQEMMYQTMSAVFHGVQTSVFAYCQSDEISLLLKDYTNLESQPWFGGNIQKIVSVAASIATVAFNKTRHDIGNERCLSCGDAFFDARIFNIPKEDVVNYFIWRQKDATRNSINSMGQANFSHAELQGKSQNEVLDMLQSKGLNWNEVPTKFKRGMSYYRVEDASFMGVKVPYMWHGNLEIPIFTEDREFISRFLESEV